MATENLSCLIFAVTDLSSCLLHVRELAAMKQHYVTSQSLLLSHYFSN